jgi:U4/U6 small nuclear ribonucleoprotein PRP31
MVMLASMIFANMQGIELQNPTAHLQQQDADMRSGTESYFSEYSGFRSIKQKQPPPTFG